MIAMGMYPVGIEGEDTQNLGKGYQDTLEKECIDKMKISINIRDSEKVMIQSRLGGLILILFHLIIILFIKERIRDMLKITIGLIHIRDMKGIHTTGILN